MPDKFGKFKSFEGPASDGFMITPNNSLVFDQPPRSIYVGVAGNVCIGTLSSNTVLTFQVPAGAVLPIRAGIVFANTTANGLIGLF